MDTSQQHLFNDSSSYGRLKCNKQPSFERFDESFGHSFSIQDGISSFIDMDPELFSMRWSRDFDFGVPGAQSPSLVHADQIFLNGHLLPSHFNACHDSSTDSVFSRSQSADSREGLLHESSMYTSKHASDASSRPLSSSSSSPAFYSAQSTPMSASSCGSRSSGGNFKLPFVRESPKKILLRYLSFVMPLYKKVKGTKLFSSKSAQRNKSSVSNSGRTSSFSRMEWCHGNTDTAVYDAILYCKRSIGQDM